MAGYRSNPGGSSSTRRESSSDSSASPRTTFSVSAPKSTSRAAPTSGDSSGPCAASDAAVEGGVNWIDTAPFYGWGRAEEVVRKALRWHDDLLVFTKCGTFRRDDGDGYMDLTPDAIRRDVEGSLRRLRRDHVD